MAEITTDTLAALSVCPVCDTLHRRRALGPGEVARCVRCGTVIETRKPRAIERVIGASVASATLISLAVWAPFLTLTERGLRQQISLVDAAEALAHGWFWPLGVLLALFTVLLPFLRAACYLYALVPVRLGRRELPLARPALRLAGRLRPWAMAEIFMIGVAVSLIKLAGIATVEPGPAFWALGGLVAVIGFESAAICRETLWSSLAERPA